MEHLQGKSLEAALARLPNWRADNGALVRTYTFPDFIAAMEFVNNIAKLAESKGHHPDIDIRYNKVKLSLITHDAGGMTAKDADMAELISQNFAG